MPRGIARIFDIVMVMQVTTLCFLIKEDAVCLGRKKRGFGVGKWNGVGGKVEEGETIKGAAVRELEEEIGVRTEEAHLNPRGVLQFYFDGAPGIKMHIFCVEQWEREPSESDEMAPAWFRKGQIPFEEMWVDDPHWLPQVLEGKKVEGSFYFVGPNFMLHDFSLTVGA